MIAPRSVERDYVFQAPVQAVFDAWTDGAALLQWWCPGNSQATRVELDVRPGGRYAIDMSPGPTGTAQRVHGEYVAVEPPHRLVMTWRAQGTPHDNGDGCLLTLEFQPHPQGTRLRLLHEQLPGGSQTSYANGWDAVLRTLASFVARPRAAST